MKSPGLQSEQEFLKKAESLSLNQDQAKFMFFVLDRARKAYEQREKNWEYFDGLTYYRDYILNRQAANTYLRPKKNDDEVRVSTGVTEKKIEVVYNELLALNLQPQVRAYDQDDNLMEDLGEQFTDIILRTNEIEKDDDIWQEAILELLTQRAVFVEEIWVNEKNRDKRFNGKVGVRNIQMARKRLKSGLKVFLGDITLPWYRFDDQPYIIDYDRVHWKEAEAIFKDNKNWKYVKPGNSVADNLFGLRFGTLDGDEVEILTYQSAKDDEYCRIVAGVPMDELGTKLPWEHNGYNLKMFGLKTMSRDFAYCKPLTASSKTIQSLSSESIRLLIRKWQQVLEPPLGVKSANVFSKDIWSPGAITQGISKDDFERLTDHQGITAGDFGMADFIDKKAEEFIGAGSLQQGLGTKGNQTATEIQQLQKQFTIQLGNSVLACMAMKRDMSYLRIYNVLENGTKPVDKKLDPLTKKVINVYAQYTKDEADLGTGKIGRKRIMFMDRDLSKTEIDNMFSEEEKLDALGKPTRFFTINVKKLLEIPINWYVSVSQGFKNSDSLDKVLFSDSLKQAQTVSQLSGRPLAGDNIVQDFQKTWKKKDWFQKNAPESIMPSVPSMNPMGTPQGEQLKPDSGQMPSINTLERNP